MNTPKLLALLGLLLCGTLSAQNDWTFFGDLPAQLTSVGIDSCGRLYAASEHEVLVSANQGTSWIKPYTSSFEGLRSRLEPGYYAPEIVIRRQLGSKTETWTLPIDCSTTLPLPLGQPVIGFSCDPISNSNQIPQFFQRYRIGDTLYTIGRTSSSRGSSGNQVLLSATHLGNGGRGNLDRGSQLLGMTLSFQRPMLMTVGLSANHGVGAGPAFAKTSYPAPIGSDSLLYSSSVDTSNTDTIVTIWTVAGQPTQLLLARLDLASASWSQELLTLRGPVVIQEKSLRGLLLVGADRALYTARAKEQSPFQLLSYVGRPAPSDINVEVGIGVGISAGGEFLRYDATGVTTALAPPLKNGVTRIQTSAQAGLLASDGKDWFRYTTPGATPVLETFTTPIFIQTDVVGSIPYRQIWTTQGFAFLAGNDTLFTSPERITLRLEGSGPVSRLVRFEGENYVLQNGLARPLDFPRRLQLFAILGTDTLFHISDRTYQLCNPGICQNFQLGPTPAARPEIQVLATAEAFYVGIPNQVFELSGTQLYIYRLLADGSISIPRIVNYGKLLEEENALFSITQLNDLSRSGPREGVDLNFIGRVNLPAASMVVPTYAYGFSGSICPINNNLGGGPVSIPLGAYRPGIRDLQLQEDKLYIAGLGGIYVQDFRCAIKPSLEQLICLAPGETFTFRGQVLQEPGDYNFTEVGTDGCTIRTMLHVDVVRPLIEEGIICSPSLGPDNPYRWRGKEIIQPGRYETVTENPSGCTTTYILDVFNPNQRQDTVCFSSGRTDSILFYGQVIKSAGLYTHTVPASAACPGNYTLLVESSIILDSLIMQKCVGESFFANGVSTNFDQPGRYIVSDSIDQGLCLAIRPYIFEVPRPDTIRRDSIARIGSRIFDQRVEAVGQLIAGFLEIDGSGCREWVIFKITQAVGVADPSELQGVQLFPNPARDQIYLSGLQLVGPDLKVELFDLLGNQLMSSSQLQVHNSSSQLSVGDLPPGTYLLRLSVAAGAKTWKVVVQ